MKNLNLCFLFLFAFIFIACSNNQVSLDEEVEINTIKMNIQNKESDTLWTSELEGEFLNTKYDYSDSKIGNVLPVTYDLFYFDYDYKELVFPELDSFGSLDTSKIPQELLLKTQAFINDVSKNPYGDFSFYFDKAFYFSYIFFLNKLKNNYQEIFNIEFPYKDLDKSDTKDSEDASKTLENQQEEVAPLFTSSRIGQAFISSDLIQIPVRLYNKKNYLDIDIFVKVKGYLIYNIEIKNWSKADE
ncbi:MAG: hypothetical protein K5866_04960 [Treponema sp.]|nr:hypothetical protein [Treponema sp.]